MAEIIEAGHYQGTGSIDDAATFTCAVRKSHVECASEIFQ